MPLLFHLPEPIGWIALTPDTLREAQAAAAAVLPNPPGRAASSNGAAALVSADEAAKKLDIDASWLMRQARVHKVPSFKVGKYVRFDVEALREHLAREPTRRT